MLGLPVCLLFTGIRTLFPTIVLLSVIGVHSRKGIGIS
jgi:hypothetical protein